MNWIEINIVCDADKLDLASVMLTEAGANGTSIRDDAEFARTLDESEYTWDYIEPGAIDENARPGITAWLPDDECLDNRLAFIRDECARLGCGQPVTSKVEETDWVNAYKQYYKPFRIGERVVICPSWEEYSPSKSDVVIQIDPGMAFGTGTHETTMLCVELLERYMPAARVIDVGCGTGILAITAKKLGAEHVCALDFDNVCVRVAKENAALNDADIAVSQGDLLKGVSGTADVIVANIVADAIIALIPDASGVLAPDGVLIASGIIHDRLENVLNAAERSGLTLLEKRAMGEWVAIVLNQK